LKKFERATITRIGRRQINTRQRCWQCFLPARQSRSAQISPKLNGVSTLTPPGPQGFSGSASEIIADNLSKAGWSWGCVSAIDSNGRTIFVVDAHRDDGKRLVVHADEKLTAFLELERITHELALSVLLCDNSRRNQAASMEQERV
jgi:hypothetical protein